MKKRSFARTYWPATIPLALLVVIYFVLFPPTIKHSEPEEWHPPKKEKTWDAVIIDKRKKGDVSYYMIVRRESGSGTGFVDSIHTANVTIYTSFGRHDSVRMYEDRHVASYWKAGYGIGK